MIVNSFRYRWMQSTFTFRIHGIAISLPIETKQIDLLRAHINVYAQNQMDAGLRTGFLDGGVRNCQWSRTDAVALESFL